MTGFKLKVRTDNIWCVFRLKPLFSHSSGVVWKGLTCPLFDCFSTRIWLLWRHACENVLLMSGRSQTGDKSLTWRKWMRRTSLNHQCPFVCFVSACKWRHYAVLVVQLPTNKHKRNKWIYERSCIWTRRKMWIYGWSSQLNTQLEQLWN